MSDKIKVKQAPPPTINVDSMSIISPRNRRKNFSNRKGSTHKSAISQRKDGLMNI